MIPFLSTFRSTSFKSYQLTALFVLLLAISGISQNEEVLPYSNSWTVVSGLTQPIFLNGVNIAVNYTTNRWVFEYSHGAGLEYSGQALKQDYRDHVVSLNSPYSTGPGIGYRVFANQVLGMDIRAEAKVHQYDVSLNDNQDISYTNFDLGGGAYWQIRPFGKQNNRLSGIVVEPSIRYWANVASSLENEVVYTTNNGETQTHSPYPLNLFFNISIGYTFVK